ncbi:MauE/DoxX family redox-associated membrane protein [Spirochaetota bacterium]
MSLLKKTIKDISYGNRITAAIRIVMGLLFVFSGFFKVIDPEAFSKIIIMYDIIPLVLVPYCAIVVPVLELLLGILLVAGYKVKASAFISMILMIMFSIFIAINIYRGASFDCGCFELNRLGLGFDETLSIKLVIRDIILLLLFLIVFRAKRNVFSLEGIIEKASLKDI